MNKTSKQKSQVITLKQKLFFICESNNFILLLYFFHNIILYTIHNKLIYYATRKNQHQRKSGFNT